MNDYSPSHPICHIPSRVCVRKSNPSRRWVIASQGLFGDLVQVAETILVDHGHSEVGHVHDQSLLDLTHALLEDVVRLFLAQFCGNEWILI